MGSQMRSTYRRPGARQWWYRHRGQEVGWAAVAVVILCVIIFVAVAVDKGWV